MIAPFKTPGDSEVRYRSAILPPARIYSSEHQASGVASPIGNRIADSIGQYPLVAVTASAVVGVTLGWFVKRRWNG